MDRRLAYVGLFSIAFVWGATFPIIKNTLPYVDALSFLFYRFLIASLVLFPFVFRRIKKKDAIYGTLVGIPLFIGYVTQTVGLQYTSPSMSGLITGLYVVLTPIFAIFILKGSRDFTNIIFAAVAFIGMALMTFTLSSGQLYGNFLTLICAVTYAIQMVYSEKYLKNSDPLVFTFFQLMLIAVLSLLFHPSAIYEINALRTPYVIFSVFFNAIVGSSVAIWVMSISIKNTNSYISALILITEPIFAVVVSTVAFHYPLTLSMVIGGVIILVSMALAIRRENYKINHKSSSAT